MAVDVMRLLLGFSRILLSTSDLPMMSTFGTIGAGLPELCGELFLIISDLLVKDEYLITPNLNYER